jgi:hypothetical protein
MNTRGQFGLFLLIASAVVGAPGPASATSCATEQLKIVQDPLTSYGNKTAMYVYPRAMVSCASVANTSLWLLGGSAFDYIEAGSRQYGTLPGYFKAFAEYRFYPDVHYVEYPGNWAEDQYMAFLVMNDSGTSYTLKAQFGIGTVPSTYYTILVTPSAPYNSGTPMSEISRYGDADVPGYMTSMKYRPADGSWPLWTALGCSLPNSITDWDGVKYSNASWAVVYGPVQGGGC